MESKPLLYYRTDEELARYRKKPVKEKLQWLQAQMEFFYRATPKKIKKLRDRLKAGEF
jgi:hypothetical protein